VRVIHESPVADFPPTLRRCLRAACLGLLATAAWAQDPVSVPDIPKSFKLDMETAERLRPALMAQSVMPTGRYATGSLVFNRLVEHAAVPARILWQLRIVDDGEFNAYSSPDGTIYVQSGLAKLAGASAGLWAALLSHEIAHVLSRDWARRYLYQRKLENNAGGAIVLGDPSLPSAEWADPSKASAEMARFCRQMELDADRAGLLLMAKAGYHPDFMPALHHLLHAADVPHKTVSLYAMHPCWDERDRELNHAYVVASIEFARQWPEWYASPGGNPPVVVFAEPPTVRKAASHTLEVQVPMRCQNLAGAVEVVLHLDGGRSTASTASAHELRQLTGCTSPRTTVTFLLPQEYAEHSSKSAWSDIYVLDAWGSVLARSDLPRIH